MSNTANPGLPAPPHLMDSWHVKSSDDGLSDIADALGIKVTDSKERATLADFIRWVKRRHALSPPMAAYFSSYPWATTEEKPADIIKAALALDGDAPFVIPGNMSQFSPKTLSECILWCMPQFRIAAVDVCGDDFSRAEDILWLPIRRPHAYAFALVAMLWIFMTDLSQEYERYTWEQMLRPYSEALNHLRLSYRCPVCTMEFNFVDEEHGVCDTSCTYCAILKEGEIPERPYIGFHASDVFRWPVHNMPHDSSQTSDVAQFEVPLTHNISESSEGEVRDLENDWVNFLGNDTHGIQAILESDLVEYQTVAFSEVERQMEDEASDFVAFHDEGTDEISFEPS
ncbi:hypothetical protein F5Y16DRAFT_420190 [Xylariaceae sp. FL0255]|nr:hypothetical protein F5Y16DRAFT_420190 [Xylariaceae sp. FL0255]